MATVIISDNDVTIKVEPGPAPGSTLLKLEERGVKITAVLFDRDADVLRELLNSI